MVQIDAIYQGTLRCQATHGDSGTTLLTDAPRDNQGNGQSFSPTDLVATALGTCILTTMAIAAKRLEVDLTGSKVRVLKEMASTPYRRIAKLLVEISCPAAVAEDKRLMLEQSAVTCPVSKSLHADVHTGIVFHWSLQ